MSGPLAGIRVLDLGRYIAAPFAGQILADLGAEVIKVEEPGTGDPMRQAGPTFVPDAEGWPTDMSAYLVAANRNKKSLTLDITSPAGRDLLLRLAAESHILLENFRAGFLDDHGLGPGVLHEANPRLVVCSITGFGQTGPLAARPATDSLAQAMSGLMSVTGEAGGTPQKIGVTIVDVMTGVYAATAILAALRDVEQRGRHGQRIDLSLFETALSAMSHAAEDYLISGDVPLRNGGQVEGAAPGQVFATADGWVNIQAQYDAAFPRLCDVLGLPALPADPRFATAAARWINRALLLPLLERALATVATDDLVERLVAAGVMAAPVLTVAQAFALPQALQRGLQREAVREDGTRVPLVASPLRLRGMVERHQPPPALGEHGREILGDLLGIGVGELDRLQSDGVI